jgi:hypothetical protein
MTPAGGRRAPRRRRRRPDEDPSWGRWFRDKLVPPLIAAVITIGGTVAAPAFGPQGSPVPGCVPETITDTISTRAPNGKPITREEVKKITCPKR